MYQFVNNLYNCLYVHLIDRGPAKPSRSRHHMIMCDIISIQYSHNIITNRYNTYRLKHVIKCETFEVLIIMKY